MKNKIIIPIGIGIILLLGACANLKPFVYDKNLPSYQTAHIYFYGKTTAMIATSYNGMRAPKGEYWAELFIPGGNTDFTISLDHSLTYGGFIIGGVRIEYSLRNVKFSYDFEAGKEYTILFKPTEVSMKGVSGGHALLIYDKYLPKGPGYAFFTKEPGGENLVDYLIYKKDLNEFVLTRPR